MLNPKSLTVGNQVTFIFGLIGTLLIGIGLFLFFSLRAIERHNLELQNQVLREWRLCNDLSRNLQLEQEKIFRHVQSASDAEMKELDQTFLTLKESDDRNWDDYGKVVDNSTEAQLYSHALQARKNYLEQSEALLTLSRTHQDREASDFVISSQAPAYEEYQKTIDDVGDWTAKEGGQMATDSTRLILQTRIAGDALVGMALLVTLWTGFSIVRITHRLKEDNTVLQNEIAARKESDEKLRAETALLDAQVNCSIDGILVVDGQGRKILQNQRMQELWKIPQNIIDDHHVKPQVAWFASQTADPRGYTTRVNYLYAHPDEKSRDEIELKDGTLLERYTSPIVSKDGKNYGRIWSFRDITERKRLEARMFQSQKMETVGKLAGGVAHEFNSILTAIIGQSELLLSDVSATDPHAARALEIRHAADRAATLTRQLLAYGRKQILMPQVLDLNDVLTDMAGTLQHLMGREVDVQINPANDLKMVKIDPGQMEQVIVNIAMNAADAMPNGGKLILETANTTLTEDYCRSIPGLKPGPYVLLAITDTGAGMTNEVKARAFEPFFSTKAVGQGVGLGLATCYGILKQSDGHINVYSEISRGTTFKIYLPQVRPPGKVMTSRLRIGSLPQGTETILLAEDDPSLLVLCASLLRGLGYNVLTATNGIEALSLKQQRNIGHIDLLFTDIVMPHMSGKELSDRIRAIYPSTKILFTSAYTENAIVHQGMLNEGVILLQKPFTPSALANKVREVLDHPSPLN